MQLSGLSFLYFFLPLVLAVYYIPAVRKRTGLKNLWLLLASLGFYAWSGVGQTLLLVLSVAVNFLLSLWAEKYVKKPRGKVAVGVACAVNIGLLFVFKFLSTLLNGLMGVTGLVLPKFLTNIALPLGISFYTFKMLSYVIDVYRGKVPAQRNVVTLGLYAAFFPAAISGPILKYHATLPQLENRQESMTQFAGGVTRFVIGLGKTLLLSVPINRVATAAFDAQGSDLSVLMAWLGALAYMLYIYFDFSGYTDMAVGVGQLFGFTLPENFRYPYVSRSVSEYWRRWHITLGEWFQEYLYYPFSLGPAIKIRKWAGKRKVFNRKRAGMLSMAASLLVVWVATGVWHGPNLTYVVWGLLNFALVMVDTYKKPATYTRLTSVVGFAGTMLFTLLTKVIFNAANLGQVLEYFASMLHLNGNALVGEMSRHYLAVYGLYLLVGLVCAFPVAVFVRRRVERLSPPLRQTAEVMRLLLLVGVFLLALAYALSGGYNPPLYANF